MTSLGEQIGKRDFVIAGAFSLLGLLLMYASVHDEEVGASVLAIPVFLAVTVPLAWRRAAPLAALAATFVGLLVHVGLFGTEVIRCGVVLPAAFLLVFAAAAKLERREALIALAAGLGSVVVVCLTDGKDGADPGFLTVLAPLTVAVWGIGRVVRSRGRMADELAVRTGELQEARDERARLEVATDRARLSGELDELLQRHLGELARLADAGGRANDPETATATLVDIERESRRTLEEMRTLVGVLRHDGSDLQTAPQPTLTHLEALLVRAKGTDARLTVEGSPRVLPAGVELSAFRIVEHLLGALEDSPDVDVRVAFGDDALELAVCGPARRRSKGAIESARERVKLHRGTLDATTRDGRSEAVVSLPLLAGI